MKAIKLIALLICLVNVSLGQTPNDDLIKASGGGDLPTVKSLVEGGANVNYKNAGGATPISSAYMWPDVTEYLLSKSADANGGDFPALVNAARFYSVDVMKLLLKAGADPNKIAEVKVDMRAPVQKLLDEEKAKGKKGNKYLVKAYEDQLAKMPAGNTMTFSALGTALNSTNCEECVELLLNAGSKTDFKSAVTGGNSVHEVAFSWVPVEQRAASHKAMVDYFEKASIPIPDWYKNLDVSIFGNAYGILKLLKGKGADFEYLDVNKRTPLTSAVLQPAPNEEVIMALVDNGASLKATGRNNDDTDFLRETSNPDKIKVKFDFPREGRASNNGGGYSANMEMVNPKPKRVALISYYLYDAGKGKANITGTGAWVTSASAGQGQVNGFYAKSIQSFKDGFKQNGIELLTPDEFLDTQEKAELYYGFVQESAKKEKTTITRSKTRSSTTSMGGGWTMTTYTTTTATASTLKVCPSGMGYREFFVANEGEDESAIANFQSGVFSSNRKLTSNLGNELCRGLGVDAVVVVYIATRKPKQIQEDYGVNAVVAIMLGPNPVRADADAESKNSGQFYCGTRTYYSSPVIFKEAKGIFGQYDGMANILKAHADKMCKYVNGKEKDE